MDDSTVRLDGALKNRARSAAHLAAEQSEIVSMLEQQTVSPDLLFHIFRARHLAARTSHEANLIQVLAGGKVLLAESADQRASIVARASVEGAVDYQNVKVSVKDDFALSGDVVPIIVLALTLMLDSATENKRFGRVDLTVELEDRIPSFNVIDHGDSLDDARISQIIETIDDGLNHKGVPRAENNYWLLGAALHGISLEVDIEVESNRKGNRISLILDQKALGDIRRVPAVVPARSASPAPIAPTPVQKERPEDPPLYKATLARLGMRDAGSVSPVGAPSTRNRGSRARLD